MFAKLRIAVLALAFIVGACVSGGLPEGATPEHRYYAARADYNLAKRVVLAYVRLPSTPHEHKVAIVELVTRVDGKIRRFEVIRSAAASGDYAIVIREISNAVLELQTYTAGG